MNFRTFDTPAINSGWAWLFSPRVLFLLGTLQALTPYLFWYLQGTNPLYIFDITYIPLLVFAVGYAAFCIGTLLAPKARPKGTRYELSLDQIRVCTFALAIVLLGEIVFTIRGYGTIPIFSYLSGDMFVGEVNAVQSQMESGQLGALTSTLSLLNGLLLLTIIGTIRTRRRSHFLILASLFLLLFGGSLAGKRQAAVMTVVFLACGLAIRFGNPVGALLRALNLPRAWAVRAGGLTALAVGLFTFVAVMPSVRTGSSGNTGPLTGILDELSLPLMNYESECASIGLSPYQLNFLDPLRSLIPKRSSLTDTLPFNDPPILPEPTAPSGFYSPVHWGLGAAGAWVFAAFCGFLSQLSFSRARFSTGYLLIYSQISWALLSAHTYNHFLNLVFLPVPVIGFTLFSWFAAHAGARRVQLTHRPVTQPRLVQT